MNTCIPRKSSWSLASALLLLFLLTVGCRQQYERANYNQPYVGPVRELVFTTTSFGATNLKPELFSSPVAPEEQLAFTGHVGAPKPTVSDGVLRMTIQHGSKTVDCRNAHVVLEEGDGQDGFKFRSEVKAPKKPGKYAVTIKVRDALLAHGEITVQEPRRQ